MTGRVREIRFGDFLDVCELCSRSHTRFATLVDPVGRYWLLCVDCVKSLWEDKHAVNHEEHDHVTVESAMQVLRDFIESQGELCQPSYVYSVNG